MYAVFVTGGKQYKLTVGETQKVEILNVEPGQEVKFDKVLMVIDGDNVKIGAPYLVGAEVIADVVGHGRHKKIEIIKFKRRKHHMKHMGHRQYFTEIKIKEIKS